MKKYIINNDEIRTLNLQEDFLKDSFPPAIYSVQKDMRGFYLKKIDERFELPTQIYGTTMVRAEKTIRAFKRREGSTGILLTGLKGTGKTLLAKVIANQMIDLGYPVIRVNDQWYGDTFNTFIQELGECCLIFDEFVKVYTDPETDADYQQELLSLFDGVASSKKLILLTENKYSEVDDLYKNRPSRVYYSWEYRSVEPEIVEGYAKENLIDQNLLENVVALSNKIHDFSFDVLQSIIEECNANQDTGVPFEEYIEDLNLDTSTREKYVKILSGERKNFTLKENLVCAYDWGFNYELRDVNSDVSYHADEYFESAIAYDRKSQTYTFNSRHFGKMQVQVLYLTRTEYFQELAF